MSEIRFTKTHEWVCINDDQTVTIGITDHAQHALGDMVFVELPEIGAKVFLDKECGVVESVKSASDIYSPLSGEVVAINEAVVTSPEIINKKPQDEGWLFKIKPADLKELDNLMDLKAYEQYLAELTH